MTDEEIYQAHLEIQHSNEAQRDTIGGSGLPYGPCGCRVCRRVRFQKEEQAQHKR